MVDATEAGYRDVAADPEVGLVALLDAVPELDQADQSHQLAALEDADAFRARRRPSTARRSPPGNAGTASTGSSPGRSTSTDGVSPRSDPRG